MFELIENMERSEVANNFFKGYLCKLFEGVISITTDTFHKPGFSDQAKILGKLFNVVDGGTITVSLWSQGSFANNQMFFRLYCVDFLTKKFTNTSKEHIEKFVDGCFAECRNEAAFKTLLRDFLCTLKEFDADIEDTFADEKQVKKWVYFNLYQLKLFNFFLLVVFSV